jgi:hypothetical protein
MHNAMLVGKFICLAGRFLAILAVILRLDSLSDEELAFHS